MTNQLDDLPAHQHAIAVDSTVAAAPTHKQSNDAGISLYVETCCLDCRFTVFELADQLPPGRAHEFTNLPEVGRSECICADGYE